MKFNCGEDWRTKLKRLKDWHPWFAWYPIQVGNKKCCWLERIERKGEYGAIGGDWFWEYRLGTGD